MLSLAFALLLRLLNFLLRVNEQVAEIVDRAKVVLQLLVDESKMLVELLYNRIFPFKRFFLKHVCLD